MAWAVRGILTLAAIALVWLAAILAVNVFGPGPVLKTHEVEVRPANASEILTVTAITLTTTGVPQTATARAGGSTEVPE